MNVSEQSGRLSAFTFHYLVGSPQKVERFTERHELGLFTVQEMLDAFREAGLQVIHDARGPAGRGLYLARRWVGGPSAPPPPQGDDPLRHLPHPG